MVGGRDILHRISAMVLEKEEEEIKRECPRNTTPPDTYGMDFLQLDWNSPARKREGLQDSSDLLQGQALRNRAVHADLVSL